ncbi:MAG: class I SAM-dependent methyltransferase, partial [Anaerolineae bacterium]|nr:class I SAM-dependent methyltransferase [Anaerolineae bacterium]
MKPADDPNADYKALVRRGYDRCAAAYDQARKQETEQALTALTDRLTDGAVVLDIGCGGGVPISR